MTARLGSLLILLSCFLACGARQPGHLKLKQVAQTSITFLGATKDTGLAPWDLRIHNDRLAVVIRGLRPYLRLSDATSAPFQLPKRLWQRERTYRTAGQISRFAPLTLRGTQPFRRCIVGARIAGKFHEPEFYSLSIQDRKVKLYGLLRTDKRIKIVQTYALHDGDRYLMIRTVLANLPSSRGPVTIEPAVVIDWCAKASRPAALIKPPWLLLTAGVSTFGWTGRGFTASLRADAMPGGCTRHQAILQRVSLGPGEEVTFDHSLHAGNSADAIRRDLQRRFLRPGGWFVRRRR